jgi:hypothetical protein
MNVFDQEIGVDGSFVSVGTSGHFRVICARLSFPNETSVLSFDSQKLRSGSTIPELLDEWTISVAGSTFAGSDSPEVDLRDSHLEVQMVAQSPELDSSLRGDSMSLRIRAKVDESYDNMSGWSDQLIQINFSSIVGQSVVVDAVFDAFVEN